MTTRSNDPAGPADRGLLLVGHGSREPVGVNEFLVVARLVAQAAARQPVEPSFLEFSQPTIAEGFAALVERGVGHVVVAPVLLFSAGHDQRDIPAAVAAAAAAHPGVTVEQTAHLGCHEALLELSKVRYDEALAGRSLVPAAETTLVMVGRGSLDASATAEMWRFAALCQQAAPMGQTLVGFVAMADPSLEEVLLAAARGGARRVVVEPHLLFGGVLMERIVDTVARFAGEHPHIEWVTTRHLGPSELVVRAILDRARVGTLQF